MGGGRGRGRREGRGREDRGWEGRARRGLRLGELLGEGSSVGEGVGVVGDRLGGAPRKGAGRGGRAKNSGCFRPLQRG